MQINKQITGIFILLGILLTVSCRKDSPEVTTTVKVQLTAEDADPAILKGLPINIQESRTGYTYQLTSDAKGQTSIVLPLGYYNFEVRTKRRLEDQGNVTLYAEPTGLNVIDTDDSKNSLTLLVGIYTE